MSRHQTKERLAQFCDDLQRCVDNARQGDGWNDAEGKLLIIERDVRIAQRKAFPELFSENDRG